MNSKIIPLVIQSARNQKKTHWKVAGPQHGFPIVYDLTERKQTWGVLLILLGGVNERTDKDIDCHLPDFSCPAGNTLFYIPVVFDTGRICY
jgi:hypothetical protein